MPARSHGCQAASAVRGRREPPTAAGAWHAGSRRLRSGPWRRRALRIIDFAASSRKQCKHVYGGGHAEIVSCARCRRRIWFRARRAGRLGYQQPQVLLQTLGVGAPHVAHQLLLRLKP